MPGKPYYKQYNSKFNRTKSDSFKRTVSDTSRSSSNGTLNSNPNNSSNGTPKDTLNRTYDDTSNGNPNRSHTDHKYNTKYNRQKLNYVAKPIKEIDPPEQIELILKAQNVFNIGQELLVNKDYTQIKYLTNNIRNVVRSIVRKKCKELYTIDESLMRSVESDVPELKLKEEYDIYESTPNPKTRLHPMNWSIIYRSLLPMINIVSFFDKDWGIDPESTPYELTKESYEAFFEIHCNLMLSEYAMQRDKLVEDYNDLISNEIKELDSNDPDYTLKCQEITDKYNVEMFTKYNEFKDNTIWKYVDIYRDILTDHYDDVDDFKVRMSWACLTFDLFACGVDPLLKDIIKNKELFYVEYVDCYDENEYIDMMQQLYDFFYDRYNNYDNFTCTEQQYNDWRVVNIYRELLLLILEFKSSKQRPEDLIEFDVKRLKLFNTFTLDYSKYGAAVSFKYSMINLEKKYGSNRINLGLNKLTKNTFDYIYVNLNRLYPKEVLICNVVSYGCMHVLTSNLCCEFLSRLNENIENTLNEYKNKDDNYWNFKALCYLKGCAFNEVDLMEFFKVDDLNKKAVILNSFIKNYEIGNKIKEHALELKELCIDVRDKIKGQMKYIMFDMIDILDKLI